MTFLSFKKSQENKLIILYTVLDKIFPFFFLAPATCDAVVTQLDMWDEPGLWYVTTEDKHTQFMGHIKKTLYQLVHREPNCSSLISTNRMSNTFPLEYQGVLFWESRINTHTTELAIKYWLQGDISECSISPRTKKRQF